MVTAVTRKVYSQKSDREIDNRREYLGSQVLLISFRGVAVEIDDDDTCCHRTATEQPLIYLFLVVTKWT